MGVVTPERRRTEPPPPAPPQYEPPKPRREVPWGLITLGILIIAIFGGVSWVKDVIPDIHNPFAQHTVDRSGPAVLKSIQDLQEYHAASGNFQQIVDLKSDSALPDELLGERTLFVAVGSVDAIVDFSQIDQVAVQVSDDRRSATINLPRPQISDAQLDVGKSYVYDRDRGIFNQIGSLFAGSSDDQRALYTLAEQKIHAAAQNGSGLVPRAEENTRRMLQSLLRALGFTTVAVNFEPA
jgi:Protein of unknown function (DUF4230)